mmetsp:Transcript_23124/g.68209  ORF Transcript_23124/g.68209 Transcript_23124/m.68209 type:complete len:182 (-) Transcript_23124:377-922(-)
MEETVEGMKISRYFGWGARDASAAAEGAAVAGGTLDLGHDIDKELQEAHTAPPPGSDGTTMTFGTDAPSSAAASSSRGQEMVAIPGCSRESHAVWACRGLALGCGRHLMELKECFGAGADVEAERRLAMEQKAEGKTYDEAALTARAPDCKGIQEELAGCVERRGGLLERRVRKRQAEGGS